MALKEIQATTALPAPTVYRILSALRTEGYVRREGQGRYRLQSRVRELAAGYTERSRLLDIGSDIALKATRRSRWPLAIGTLDGDAICVRFSTMPYSPLAVQSTTLGHRLGLLDSAMGLVYLAFCETSERHQLLQMLRRAAKASSAANLERVDMLLNVTQRRGYGLRLPQSPAGSATVAVPLRVNGRVMAALSITTSGRSMTRRNLPQILRMLNGTSAQISHAFENQAS